MELGKPARYDRCATMDGAGRVLNLYKYSYAYIFRFVEYIDHDVARMGGS